MAAGGPLALVQLVPRLYSFFRHTIASVRLAVPQALLVFLLAAPAVGDNPDWLDGRLFRFLFQNLIVEERADVREATLATWHAAVDRLGRTASSGVAAIEQELTESLAPWLQLTMSPPGVPLDPALFLQAEAVGSTASEVKIGRTGREAGAGHVSHNVDKNMLAQDLSLVAVDDILKGRLAAAEAFAGLVVRGPRADAASPSLALTFHRLALEYLGSTSSHQLIFLAVVVAEWAKAVDAQASLASADAPLPPPLPEVNEDARVLVGHLGAILEGRIPPSYYEMLLFLGQIYTECQTLLAAFVTDAGINPELIPVLPPSLVPTEPPVDVFGIETASHVAGPVFDALVANVGKKTLKTALPGLREKQMRVVSSINFYLSMKERHDRQVLAAVASAVISLRTLPAKLNPVIRSIMNGIKVCRLPPLRQRR